ncbi:hypothetical protein FS837_007554, partial [Tulasnella sp. UAMH 9824]
MELFTFIVFVLAFWPILLDRSSSGRNARLPTVEVYIKTYPVDDGLTMANAVLQVPPTHMAHHNNGAQSSGWADSTVLIWTGYQVNPVRLDAVVNFTLYLLFSIAAGVALLSKATVERRVPVVQSQRKNTFVSHTTFIEGSPDCNVHGLVTKRQLSINTFTLEGRLVLSSGPSTSDSPAEWTVLFHPHQYYRPAASATEASNRNAQLDVVNKYLLKTLLRGVTAYHPWTCYTPGILVNVPEEVVEAPLTTRKQTSVQSISSIGGAPKFKVSGHTIQRRK